MSMVLKNDVVQVAMLTPTGRGAIAVLGIRGLGAVPLLSRGFQPASCKSLDQFRERQIYYGRWQNQTKPVTASPGEDVVLSRFASHWELSCHGGDAAAAAICDDLQHWGATLTTWQQWQREAGEPLLTSQVQQGLAAARTPQAALVIARQSELLASAMPWLDQPRLSIEQRESIQQLLATWHWAKHLTKPWRIVLAGPPNAGKSSLLNALVGYERAIVFDQPGTTRDVVTALTAHDGWLWELHDTAGLRNTTEQLEVAGIERTRRELKTADVQLLIFDATVALNSSDEQLLAEHPTALLVWNKHDLVTKRDWQPTRPGLHVSAQTGEGIPTLLAAIQAKTAVPAWKNIAACLFSSELQQQFATRLSADNLA